MKVPILGLQRYINIVEIIQRATVHVLDIEENAGRITMPNNSSLSQATDERLVASRASAEGSGE